MGAMSVGVWPKFKFHRCWPSVCQLGHIYGRCICRYSCDRVWGKLCESKTPGIARSWAAASFHTSRFLGALCPWGTLEHTFGRQPGCIGAVCERHLKAPKASTFKMRPGNRHIRLVHFLDQERRVRLDRLCSRAVRPRAVRPRAARPCLPARHRMRQERAAVVDNPTDVNGPQASHCD